ncbi:MAG: DUF2752 domain-containing protein [Clostridia bacterium]|nr:DUF2752 domain-containing protein [Clostridia bacterium]
MRKKFYEIFGKAKKDLYQIRFVLLILVLYGILTQTLFGTVCPFLILMGFPCPGCGLTRATFCLFTGNFAGAIELNWTVFLWLGLIVALLIERYIKPFPFRIFPVGAMVVCGVTLVRYVSVLAELFFL